MTPSFDQLASMDWNETPWAALPMDREEAAAMQPFAAQQGAPWWQGVIQYGLTRAIDNRFGPPPVQGNAAPDSFAGQNGRTYVNRPTRDGGSAAPASGGALGTGNDGVLLLAIGAVAVYLLTR